MLKKISKLLGMVDSTNYEELFPDWFFVRLTYYGSDDLIKIKNWLDENIERRYKKIGWNEACPYEVGVTFEDPVDAMLYKLTWYNPSNN